MRGHTVASRSCLRTDPNMLTAPHNGWCGAAADAQVGKEETESFAAEQEVLAKQGKPHCKKVEKNLGTTSGTDGHNGGCTGLMQEHAAFPGAAFIS